MVRAQNAGTSWVYQQLHMRPDPEFGWLKEYHVHASRTIAELKPFRQFNAKH